ncbi:EAL domain-containing protein [Ideonella sp. 4Y16]|uniref:EAL domain-containing protein n=1 Tax=Ideonella alba TaxID=2824118 RepID=A0A940Y928_9BURK|nr:GGDEF and EAL domain-containing protein [Ideonella alba]MBQ0932182.1 EAL domain-containing protein [Ideonella alba]MBQ0943687.1 EAL domain-containing protein [Ideonella alba]
MSHPRDADGAACPLGASPPAPRESAHTPPAPGSLAARLTRLSMWAAALALLVTGAALNLATYLMGREALLRQSAEQARLVAAQLGAAVAFNDRPAMGESLQSLEGVPSITHATLQGAGGLLLGRYDRVGEVSVRAAGGWGAEPWVERLRVAAPVLLDGRELAHLELEVDTASLLERGLVFGGLTMAVGAVALTMAWLFAVGVRRDIDRVERRLDDLAHRDPVTGLFNRHAATSHLQDLVRTGDRPQRPFSLISIDLDDFKLINDTLGHAAGDAVLTRVAARLQRGLRPGGQAYRFGGDEFVVICPCEQGLEQPAMYHRLVLDALAIEPLAEAPDMQLGASVGVARFPRDAGDVAGLLQAADIAMYAAKQRGKNQLVIFEPALRERTEQWMQIANDLRGALRRNELRLQFQPIVDLQTGRTIGAEALVRWQHPLRGWMLPGDFVPVAERSGLIAELGGWVLSAAACQWVAWRQAGLGWLNLAVNVSPQQLRRGLLTQQFDQAIAASGADPHHLTVELTEHSLVETADGQISLLEALQQRGVQVAIDDFGTGLSSLSYLKRLPVNKLKIDRSFVAGMQVHEGDAAIVGATVAMAGAFGLQVVAEGIETEGQRRELAALGCHQGQGYLFSRPLSAADFEERVRQELTTAAAETVL